MIEALITVPGFGELRRGRGVALIITDPAGLQSVRAVVSFIVFSAVLARRGSGVAPRGVQ